MFVYRTCSFIEPVRLEVVVNPSEKKENPIGTRRQQQKAETRALILRSAQRLFEKNGFDKTTLRQIAKSAGVGLGTIFGHFSDKESILISTLIDDLNRTNQRAWEAMSQELPIKEKMLHLAEKGFEAWLQRPGLSRVLLREMCFTPGPDRDVLRAADQEAMERVAAMLEKAKQEGELRSDADTALTARTSFSFYLTTVLYGLDDSSSSDSENDNADISEKLDGMVGETKRFLDQLFTGIGIESKTNKNNIPIRRPPREDGESK